MVERINKICDNCLTIIDSISLELRSVELVEDSLSKLADQAIKSPDGVITIEDNYLEIVSTALYNSLNRIKEIIA